MRDRAVQRASLQGQASPSVAGERIRVAVLLPSMEIGGAEQLVLEELRELNRDPRFDFRVLLVFAAGPLADECRRAGVTVRCFDARHKPWSLLWGYARVAWYLWRQRIDVMHCHLLYLLGPWCGVLARVSKIYVTVHTKKTMTRLEGLGLSRCHVVFACGAEVHNHLRATLPTLPLQRLTNAVAAPPPVDRRAARERWTLDHNSIVIVSVGRLVVDKGYDVLLKAAVQVNAQHQAVTFLIAGTGPERERLEQLIAQHGLSGTVRLLGVVRPIHCLLAAADIYVNASRREGLALSVIEAIAHGLPVVATRVGGNADLIAADVNGLLVDAGEAPALARALAVLIDDTDRRRRYGLAAIQRYRREFQISGHCELLRAAYMSLPQ